MDSPLKETVLMGFDVFFVINRNDELSNNWVDSDFKMPFGHVA